jgi:hypothetical protein
MVEMVDTLQAYTRDFQVKDLTKWTQHTITNRGTGEIATKESCNLENLNATWFPNSNLLSFHTSAPKILYGTSLEEVRESDAEKFVEMVACKLRDECGVAVRDGLADFSLSRVDFCRNVKVSHLPSDYIRALSQLRHSRREKANYKNETLSFRNTRRELTFYDKVQEVSEKEKNVEIQKMVAGRTHDILRVEARLRNSAVVKKEFGKVPVLYVLKEGLSREKLCGEFDGLTKAEGEQLDFNFRGNLDLIALIKKDRSRNVFGRFLQVKGLSQFLAECGYDWSLVRELLESVYPTNRMTVNRWLRSLQTDQTLTLVEVDRKLIGELREKLRKVA